MEPLETLFESLNARKRPEDVAQLVLDALNERLTEAERRVVGKAARGSLRHQVSAYTSMLQDFARPVGLERQVNRARELFATAALYSLPDDKTDDPAAVEGFVRHISGEVRKAFGANDFTDDRLNRAARADAGVDLSRRRYNKLFRLLTRMEEKLTRLIREIKKYEFTRIGKSGLATYLTRDEFFADTDSACFIAYYTARCNLRSEFTIDGQQKPYDEIADALFRRCQRGVTANWRAIAHVHPHPEVFAHLGDADRGELMGRWFGVLQEVAALLRSVWDASDINRETMVVRRGNDSSTWNNTANAWNKARDNWIGLLYAMDMDAVLDAICPGKVLRLMAADVVAWHYQAGGKLDANTLVWRELPLPWEVLSGAAKCDRGHIAAVCERHGLDPIKTGWTGLRPRTHIAAYRATPELVDGVTVGSPFLATLLRRHGFFSGERLK